MTDRYSALVVELEEPIRSDDMESTIEVIKHLKGVTSVTPYVEGWEERLAIENAKRDLLEKMFAVLTDR